MRKWPLQLESHGAVIGRRQLVGRCHQRPREAEALSEAADAGDDIACQDRFIVMKSEAVPQFEIPDQTILLDLMTLDHLRLRHPARIEAVKRVEDKICVVARRPVEGNDRVQHGKIRRGDEDQLVMLLGSSDPGCSNSCSAGCGGLEQVAPSHDNFLLAYQPTVFFAGDPKRDPIDTKAAGTTRLTRLCSSGQASARSAEVEENREADVVSPDA